MARNETTTTGPAITGGDITTAAARTAGYDDGAAGRPCNPPAARPATYKMAYAEGAAARRSAAATRAAATRAANRAADNARKAAAIDAANASLARARETLDRNDNDVITGDDPAAARPTGDKTTANGQPLASTTAPAQGAFDFTTPADPFQLPNDCPAAPGTITDKVTTYRKMARDSQKQKLYDWEDGIHTEDNEPVLTDDEIRHLIFRICADHGLPQIPVITNGRRRTVSVFDNDGAPGQQPGARDGKVIMRSHYSKNTCSVYIQIATDPWHRRASVIIHETAHYITAAAYGMNAVAGHGPEFATIVRNLYAHYLGDNRDDITARARRRGVKFAD